MNNRHSALGLVFGLFASFKGFCYEVDTHAFITAAAFNRSVLSSPELAQRMGWDRFRANEPFSMAAATTGLGYPDKGYFDVTAEQWVTLPASQVRLAQQYEREQMAGERYRNSQENDREISAWLMRGAIREDDLPPSSYVGSAPDADPHGDMYRVLQHFYNPITDEGLNLGAGLQFPAATRWGLDSTSSTGGTRRNHFSWHDARKAMWCALTHAGDPHDTPRDAGIRRLCWATAIKSLGHVLHLLQDMAQPQHVRNDRHNPAVETKWYYPWWIAQGTDYAGTTVARRTMEIYTNWRITGGEISVECVPGRNGGRPATPKACNDLQEFRSMFGSHEPVYPHPLPLNEYPAAGQVPMFARPIDFFTTRSTETDIRRRRGLADFTNRTFFSEGTVNDSSFPRPPPIESTEYSVFWSHQDRTPHGTFYKVQYHLIHDDQVGNVFFDPYLSGHYVPVANGSMWETSIFGLPATSRRAVMDFENYETQADMLIPRAIGYSAGLINYFFRGQLQVTEPSIGVVSTIDHGIPHHLDPQGYPVKDSDGSPYGFTQLRLSVGNATPAMTISGLHGTASQNTFNGSLHAVAHFHRNLCYRNDLGGELRRNLDTNQLEQPQNCTVDQTRTPYEEIIVSAPITTGWNLALQDIDFDFSARPIPINATDLRVQVVYRGPIGDSSRPEHTENDAIAVGHLDLTEPLYFAVQNFTDYFWNEPGQFDLASPTHFNHTLRPQNLRLVEGFIGPDIPDRRYDWPVFYTTGPLAPARAVRVAVIGYNSTGWIAHFRAIFEPDREIAYASMPFTSSAQLHRQGPREELAPGEYAPFPMLKVRGLIFNAGSCAFRTATFWPTQSRCASSLPWVGNGTSMPNLIAFGGAPRSKALDQPQGVNTVLQNNETSISEDGPLVVPMIGSNSSSKSKVEWGDEKEHRR
jgi:hypothetical protein